VLLVISTRECFTGLSAVGTLHRARAGRLRTHGQARCAGQTANAGEGLRGKGAGRELHGEAALRSGGRASGPLQQQGPGPRQTARERQGCPSHDEAPGGANSDSW